MHHSRITNLELSSDIDTCTYNACIIKISNDINGRVAVGLQLALFLLFLCRDWITHCRDKFLLSLKVQFTKSAVSSWFCLL